MSCAVVTSTSTFCARLRVTAPCRLPDANARLALATGMHVHAPVHH